MDRKTAWDAAVPLVSAIIGGSAVALFGYLGTSREMDVKMVEIAVGILAREPTPPIRPAREWAVDIINEYSNVSLSPQARAALLENQIDAAGFAAVQATTRDLAKTQLELSGVLDRLNREALDAIEQIAPPENSN